MRKMLSEVSKRCWSDPEYRAKTIKGMKAAFSKPEVIARRKIAQKIVCNTPERRRAKAEKQAQYLASLTPEQKAERIERIKAGMAASRARKLAEQAGSGGV
jgi:hypothetical protein